MLARYGIWRGEGDVMPLASQIMTLITPRTHLHTPHAPRACVASCSQLAHRSLGRCSVVNKQHIANHHHNLPISDVHGNTFISWGPSIILVLT